MPDQGADRRKERLRNGGMTLMGAALGGLLARQRGNNQSRALSRPDGGQDGHDASGRAGGRNGRDATAPSEIPSRGLWQTIKRTASEASADRLMTEAAGVTFYTLLALFPALAALVSLYALFFDPATINDHLNMLSGVVPGGGMDIITEQVQRMASTADGSLGLSAIIGLAASLWSSNQAAKAMFDALNVVYEEKEKRGFIRLTLTTLTFTLAMIVFAILTMAAVVILPVVLSLIPLGDQLNALLQYGRWPLMLILVGLVLACLYRWGPSRATARWRWVTWGGAFAAITWLVVSGLFSWYVANFGSYNETYGSLGAVIGFMTWIWISAIVILLGAELNAELEHQTARDTTTGNPQPMGDRRARMADTVAGR